MRIFIESNFDLRYLVVPICLIDNSEIIIKHKWYALIFFFSEKILRSDPTVDTDNDFAVEINNHATVYILNVTENTKLPIDNQEFEINIPDYHTSIKLLHSNREIANLPSINIRNISNHRDYNYEFLLMVIGLHNFTYNELCDYRQTVQKQRIRTQIADFGEYTCLQTDKLMWDEKAIAKAVKFLGNFVKPADLYDLDLPALSGGEMQRLGAARVFAKKNLKLLLLDEPTSALDAFTEAEIIRSYKKTIKGIATLAVSHRLFTIKDADKICWIKDGKIDWSECGTHEELIQENTCYNSAWKLQNY